MSKRVPKLLLNDILDSISKINEYTASHTFDSLYPHDQLPIANSN